MPVIQGFLANTRLGINGIALQRSRVRLPSAPFAPVLALRLHSRRVFSFRSIWSTCRLTRLAPPQNADDQANNPECKRDKGIDGRGYEKVADADGNQHSATDSEPPSVIMIS